MNRSKKIFLAGAIVFAIFIAIVSWDISRRTTFPGSKPQLKERLKQQYVEPDSVQPDSATQR
jgi:hypothetical protein